MTGLLALSTVALLGLIAAIVVGLAFAGGLVMLSLRRRGEEKPDIPPGMRPGPADEVLERRHVERTMAWGVVFTAVIAVSVAWVWLNEPDQNVDDAIELVARAEERGERWFGIADEANPTGFGCARCHGTEAEGGTVPYTNAEGEVNPAYPVPALNNVCSRLPVDHPDRVDIKETIMEGREGTPMPSWSVRFEGPMNDQQIQDLMAYIISIQEGVPFEENLCTNPAALAEADAEAEEPAPGPSPDVTPGFPAEEEPSKKTESPEADGSPAPDASPETEDA